jgi:uncharacterized Zn finger protein
VTLSYDCPECGADVEVEADETVRCSECGALLELDPDIAVVDGDVHDRSSLKVKKPDETEKLFERADERYDYAVQDGEGPDFNEITEEARRR